MYPSVPVENLSPLIVFFKLSFKLLLLMKKFVLRYQLHAERADQSYQRQQITALAYVKIVYVIAVFLCSVRKHFYFRFIFPHVYNTTHPLFLTIQLCKRSLYNNQSFYTPENKSFYRAILTFYGIAVKTADPRQYRQQYFHALPGVLSRLCCPAAL